MNRILVTFLLLTIWPALSSAKDPAELCPRTLKFLKDPLPATAELYRSVMAGVLADLKRQGSTEGATQSELFCSDARARLWTRLLAGAPSEVSNLNETQLIIGDYYFQLKKYELARDAYFKVHTNDPTNIYAALRLAKIAGLTFQREAQRAYLKIAMEKISKDPKVIPEQQEAFLDYANLSNRTEAESFIRKKWAKAFPQDYRRALALIKIGQSARDLKVLKEGIEILGRLAPEEKTSSLVFYYRGLLNYIKKDFPQAQADLQTFLTNPSRDTSVDLEAVKMLIESTQATKDLIGTKQWLEWAFEKGWLRDEPFLSLHEKSVRLEDHPGLEGLNALRKSLSFHKKSLPIESALARRALALAEGGVIIDTQARVTVDNLEMDYPESPEASYLHGRYLRLVKQFSQAQVYFNKAKTRLESAASFLNKDLRDEFLTLGAENLLSIGKPDEAKLWVDWAAQFSDLSKAQKDSLETLKNKSVRKKGDF